MLKDSTSSPTFISPLIKALFLKEAEEFIFKSYVVTNKKFIKSHSLYNSVNSRNKQANISKLMINENNFKQHLSTETQLLTKMSKLL